RPRVVAMAPAPATDPATATPAGASASPRRFTDASRDLLRSTVFAAVDGLAAERAWGAITMAEIARAAGVSRQTLYNEFGSRDELAQAYVLWASEQFLVEIERVVGARPDDLG